MSNTRDTRQIERLLRGSPVDARVDQRLHARVMSALEPTPLARQRRGPAMALAVAGCVALVAHLGWQLRPPAPSRADLSGLPRIAARLGCDAAASLDPLWPALPSGAEGEDCAAASSAERRLRQEWLALKTDLETILPAKLLAWPQSEPNSG